MSHGIDYGTLMHRAMRSLIRDVLDSVAENGLPGQHHFFITFDTSHPDVAIAEWLRKRYPDEMTVVIQHWFENLDVTDQGFSVTLNFGDAPEPLHIPYDAISTFVDPSVEFGLRFEKPEDEEEGLDGPDTEPDTKNGETGGEAPLAEDVEAADTAHHDAEIVRLDSFRK